jgi:transposase
VRARIDGKYVLSLHVTDQGFHDSVLSEFRTRLLQGGLESIFLDRLLACCQERGWLKARGQQRTDATHMVGAVKVLNHLELVGETLRHALNVLATVMPDWLKAHTPVEWFDRDSERVEDYRLPKEKPAREALRVQIGEDGYALLDLLHHDPALEWLHHLPAIQAWTQHYRRENGHAVRLTPAVMPAVGAWLRSPSDPLWAQARFRLGRL